MIPLEYRARRRGIEDRRSETDVIVLGDEAEEIGERGSEYRHGPGPGKACRVCRDIHRHGSDRHEPARELQCH